MLAVCFALFSCAKQEPQAGDDNQTGSGSHGETLDYITAVSPGTPVKTTTEDGIKVLWTDADQIGIYADGSATAVYKADLAAPSAQAVFGRISDSRASKVGGQYYAVYPSSAINKWGSKADIEEQTSSFCYVNVPKQQIAEAGAWDKKAAILVASSADEQFMFKHAVAYLRFEVTDQTGDFVSVRLESTADEVLSDSQVGIKLQTSGELEYLPSSSASDFVTLRSPAGTSAFAPGTYYMAFLPGEYAGGLTLFFSNAEGLTAEQTLVPQTLKAGEVADCGPIAPLTFSEGLTPLEVGSVYMENGVNQGVVYWVDPDNPYKGKIVSASSAEVMDWSDGTIWTAKIESKEDGLANYNQFNSSDVYTSQKERFYALQYCENLRETLGGNWYLPAPVEVSTLFQVYYGLSVIPETNGVDYRFDDGVLNASVMSAKAEFDSALSALGETVTGTLDGDADADGVSDNNGYGDASGVTYWTSKVNTGGAVQYVNIGVYNLNNTGKVAKQAYVRCVRDVALNGEGGDDSGDDTGGDDSGDDSGDDTGGDNPGDDNTGGEDNPGGDNTGGDNTGGDDSGEGGDEGGDTGGDEGDDNTGNDGGFDQTTPGIDPLDPFDIFNMPIKVSLVGDSITTFEGTLVTDFADSENGGAYYPTGNVTSVENQYWHKLIYDRMSNAVLEVNNSLRGSCVVRRDTHPDVDYVARVQLYGLGNPDVILIHGGTNDCTKHSADYAPRPGMYRADMYPVEAYAGMAPSAIPTDEEFKAVFDAAETASTWDEIVALEDGYFVQAYVKLLNMIHFKHPNAKVVMIIGDALTKRAQQALLKIAEHYEQLYGYKCVNFFGLADSISKASGAHPDDAGFTFMADKIFEEVGSYINAR